MTDELDTAIKDALAEVLNLAAQVVELQLDDVIRSDLYELLDSVADYYGINIAVEEEEHQHQQHTYESQGEVVDIKTKRKLNLIVNNDTVQD